MNRDPDPFDLLAGARAPRVAGRRLVRPLGLEREDRVRILGEWAAAVLAGREPARTAEVFVASGLSAWLENGGSLTRDYWRTAGEQGSTHTEAVLWRRILEEALREEHQRVPDGGTMAPSKLEDS